jgi:hypothetical protein
VGLDAGEGDRWVGINMLSRGLPVLYIGYVALLQLGIELVNLQ